MKIRDYKETLKGWVSPKNYDMHVGCPSSAINTTFYLLYHVEVSVNFLSVRFYTVSTLFSTCLLLYLSPNYIFLLHLLKFMLMFCSPGMLPSAPIMPGWSTWGHKMMLPSRLTSASPTYGRAWRTGDSPAHLGASQLPLQWSSIPSQPSLSPPLPALAQCSSAARRSCGKTSSSTSRARELSTAVALVRSEHPPIRRRRRTRTTNPDLHSPPSPPPNPYPVESPVVEDLRRRPRDETRRETATSIHVKVL